jgi:hypothetical protein
MRTYRINTSLNSFINVLFLSLSIYDQTTIFIILKFFSSESILGIKKPVQSITHKSLITMSYSKLYCLYIHFL